MSYCRAESRLRKARWRQWADEQLQQQERQGGGGGPMAPPMPPPASADNMSPEVAAAVQRQQPFIRRQPEAAAQPAAGPDTAHPGSQRPAQPQPVVHIPAEVCQCNSSQEPSSVLLRFCRCSLIRRSHLHVGTCISICFVMTYRRPWLLWMPKPL